MRIVKNAYYRIAGTQRWEDCGPLYCEECESGAMYRARGPDATKWYARCVRCGHLGSFQKRYFRLR